MDFRPAMPRGAGWKKMLMLSGVGPSTTTDEGHVIGHATESEPLHGTECLCSLEPDGPCGDLRILHNNDPLMMEGRITSHCRGGRPAALRLLACAPERGR